MGQYQGCLLLRATVGQLPRAITNILETNKKLGRLGKEVGILSKEKEDIKKNQVKILDNTMEKIEERVSEFEDGKICYPIEAIERK